MRETLSPANRLDRQQRHEVFWQSRKKNFFVVISILSILLQLLFLGNMSYLYGSLWKSTSRYNAFDVLYVDYDEGVLGQSVSQAYEQLRGPEFPNFVQRDKELYPSMEDVIGAIKDTSYWAAFVVAPRASDRITDALSGQSMAQ